MKHLWIITLLFCKALALFAHLPQTGKATYYGKKFHGRKTASGESLDNREWHAAHRTLPFGTWVKVTNVKNDAIAFVKIVDRGPFRKGRIIDISYGAAEKLGFLLDGVADVAIEVIKDIDWLINPELFLIPMSQLPVTSINSGDEEVVPVKIPLRTTHKKRRWRLK